MKRLLQFIYQYTFIGAIDWLLFKHPAHRSIPLDLTENIDNHETNNI